MNPFKKNGQMTPIASINSVYVDNILASDLFRPTLIIDTLKRHRDDLGFSTEIDGIDLLNEFNEALVSEFDHIRDKANNIAVDFGKKLALVLKTLFNPSSKSRQNRKNWTKLHWDYWKTIKQVYFVGGLTSPILTKIFYNEIQQMFEQEQINDVNITFIEGSANLGTKGLSTLVTNGEYLLFDFGQTMIKRAHHIKQQNNPVLDLTLQSYQSDYLFYKHRNNEELLMIAEKLHDYMIGVIISTIHETSFQGNDIYIALANYVDEGKIYLARGGYGKLALLSDNYCDYLQEELSLKLHKDVHITLFHDTSAMALNFTNDKPTAVLSLGTAFGVSFLDIK